MSVFKPKKSLTEIEEETEYADAELNLAQKKELLRRLKAQGGSADAFRGSDGKISFRAIANWLKAKM